MKLQWKTCIRVGVTVFILYLCIHYWPQAALLISAFLSAAIPLLLGGVLAFILNIPVSFYERKLFPNSQKPSLIKCRRAVCIAAAFVTVFAVLVLVVWLVVPQLVSGVQLLAAEVPGAISSFIIWLNTLEFMPDDTIAALSSVDWSSKLDQILDVLLSGIGSVTDIVFRALSGVVSGIVSAVLSLIFAVYILASKEKLGRQFERVMNRYLKRSWTDRIEYLLSVFDDSFHRYLVGQCTEAVILGVLCTLGMLVFRLPYATMIGALIAVTALIPIAGAYIGAGVGAFMILTVSPAKALIFLVFILVLQQLEGNLIYPRVVGSSMGLPAIWVLAAVTVGGGIMGIGGIILGVPIAAALYRLLRENVRAGESSEDSPEELSAEPNPSE